jgi:colicin import membrane protein
VVLPPPHNPPPTPPLPRCAGQARTERELAEWKEAQGLNAAEEALRPKTAAERKADAAAKLKADQGVAKAGSLKARLLEKQKARDKEAARMQKYLKGAEAAAEAAAAPKAAPLRVLNLSFRAHTHAAQKEMLFGQKAWDKHARCLDDSGAELLAAALRLRGGEPEEAAEEEAAEGAEGAQGAEGAEGASAVGGDAAAAARRGSTMPHLATESIGFDSHHGPGHEVPLVGEEAESALAAQVPTCLDD